MQSTVHTSLREKDKYMKKLNTPKQNHSVCTLFESLHKLNLKFYVAGYSLNSLLKLRIQIGWVVVNIIK
uniref:Uncharacterized protein n=1 Tax=Anguilla anguilla TaxID=7936 RepID=A0A0E9X6G9_ANGAN